MMRRLATWIAGGLAVSGSAPLSAQADGEANKLIVLVRSEGCDFARLSPRLEKAGMAMARDRRTVRAIIDWPFDPKANRDMLGRPSPMIAALEVSARKSDLAALSRKVERKLGGVCAVDSYPVHERRLMTRPRHGALHEASGEPKVLTTVVRKPGISREEFIREWTQVHAGLSLAWRKARGGAGHYVQNIVVTGPDEGSLPFDGIGEIEGPGAGHPGDAERRARLETAAHAASFQDMDRSAMFTAREVILKE